jgi:hypothetical protein
MMSRSVRIGPVRSGPSRCIMATFRNLAIGLTRQAGYRKIAAAIRK